MDMLGILLTVIAAAAPAQDEFDAKRYRKELKPGRDGAAREATLKNVAFFNDTEATKLLLDALQETLRHVEALEKQRAENDQELEKALKPQLLSAEDASSVNYAGLEDLQALQKKLGDRITAEERVLRAFRDQLTQITDRASWKLMARAKDRKAARLRTFVIDVLGRIDDPEVTEFLVELLNDRDPAIRMAAGESLSHHDREHVPVPAYGTLLNSEHWQERAVAIDALGRLGGGQAVDLLVHQTAFEQGQQLAEIVVRLEQLTGQKLGRTPKAWLDWWEGAAAAFQSGPPVLTRPVTALGDGRVEYWGIRVDSLRAVFVLDVSGTMQAALDDHEDLDPPPGKSRLDLARRQVKAAISSLPSDATFNLVAYNDVVLQWEGKLMPASRKNKEAAYEWLDALVAVSATNIFDALEAAFQMGRHITRDQYYDRAADTVLFLSDGGPTAGRTTDCDEILAQVRDWNRVRKVTVHCFGIGRQINRSFMESLAAQNGGRCRFIE